MDNMMQPSNQRTNSLILLAAIVAALLALCWHANASARVQAQFPERIYRFEPVPEGRMVQHDFKVINRGDAPLNILEAKATCSCTEISYDKTIPPGGSGVISVHLNTEGDGGRDAHVAVNIVTNDPEQPESQLVITGAVEKVLDIQPPIVKLEGPVGRMLKQTVLIKPQPKYAFHILRALAKKGDLMDFALETDHDAGQPVYRLTVQITGSQKGRYFDRIVLSTDSPHKPEITIAVFANFIS
jgi:hypothetical protein